MKDFRLGSLRGGVTGPFGRSNTPAPALTWRVGWLARLRLASPVGERFTQVCTGAWNGRNSDLDDQRRPESRKTTTYELPAVHQ